MTTMEKESDVREKDDQFIYKLRKSKLTLNNYGKMSLTEQPNFTLARDMMDKAKPVLDLGVAFGFTTKILLKDGFTVVANDLEQKHLDSLTESIENEDEKNRLSTVCGDLMNLNFTHNFFGGIIGLNVMHFLSGPQLRDFLGRCFKWLSPRGILVLSTVSPYCLLNNYDKEIGKELFRNYYRNLHKNSEWPGEDVLTRDFINTEVVRVEIMQKYLPEKIHMMSSEILAREAIKAGFNIYKLEHFEEGENGYQTPKGDNKMMIASIMCIKEEY